MSTTNNELQRIREGLAGLPKGRARRIPPELRELIDRYARRRADEGARQNAIARALGVGESTVWRLWRSLPKVFDLFASSAHRRARSSFEVLVA